MFPQNMNLPAREPRRTLGQRALLGASALLFAFAMSSTCSAQVPNERCVACHGQQMITFLPIKFSDGAEVMPFVDASAFTNSAHAKLACVECHRDSHPEFRGDFGPRKFPTRREYSRSIERVCWECHNEILKATDGTVGGHAAYFGADGPLCVDCHSAHQTRPVTAAVVASQKMEASNSWSGMFATKGLEYLLVVVYAAFFIPIAVLLHRAIVRQSATAPATVPASPAFVGNDGAWFGLPDGFSVHRGHAWAIAEGDGVYKIGMDDFAGRLIGEPTALVLPSQGRMLDQGKRGWQIGVDGQTLEMLSPVRGEVLEVNHDALASPAVVAEDPYGKGWLMRVRATQPDSALTELFSGRLARAWYDDVEEKVRDVMQDRLGTVLQDGGTLVHGFARELAGEQWTELVAEFLLTKDSTKDSANVAE